MRSRRSSRRDDDRHPKSLDRFEKSISTRDSVCDHAARRPVSRRPQHPLSRDPPPSRDRRGEATGLRRHGNPPALAHPRLAFVTDPSHSPAIDRRMLKRNRQRRFGSHSRSRAHSRQRVHLTRNDTALPERYTQFASTQALFTIDLDRLTVEADLSRQPLQKTSLQVCERRSSHGRRFDERNMTDSASKARV
jgi:hypothetical protein